LEWLRVQLDVFPVSDDDGMIVTPTLTTSVRSVYKWWVVFLEGTWRCLQCLCRH